MKSGHGPKATTASFRLQAALRCLPADPGMKSGHGPKATTG
jgi:hypothetical protein